MNNELENPMAIHYVKWADAQFFKDGWLNHDGLIKEATNGLCIIETVGYLIYQNDEYVCLAMSVGKFSADALLKIPRACIKHMLKLDEPDDDHTAAPRDDADGGVAS